MKKPLSLLLALVMVFALFSACGNDGGTTSTTPTPTPAGTSATPAPEGNGDDEDTGLVYPMMTEEPATFTVWQTFSNTYIASMNDSKFVAEFQRRTNVLLEFKEVSSADATTNFNLMMASQDFTDVIRPGTNQYVGGPDKAITDDVYLRLNDLLEENAPNYWGLLSTVPNLGPQSLTDDGNMWSMYTVANPAEYPWMGVALRGDILEDAGVALPATIADWEVALTTMKDAGVTAPLALMETGILYNSEFASAWDVANEFYQVDGIVKFGMIEDGFREYVTTMADWYSKGLVDPEFTSHGITFAIFSGEAFTDTANGKIGASVYPWGYTDMVLPLTGRTDIEGFTLSAVSAPKLYEGQTVRYRYTSYEAKSPNAITTACKDPALLIRTLDYLFTDEGELFMNYGTEGESFDMVDGSPRFKDIILKNPEGFQPRDVMLDYTWDDGIGISDFKRLWQSYVGTDSEKALEAYDIWNMDTNEYCMPQAITLTEAENTEYSATYQDIKTYWNENLPRFITGSLSVANDYDGFVAQLKAMGIERCIEIQQAGLDRYNAR